MKCKYMCLLILLIYVITFDSISTLGLLAEPFVPVFAHHL